MVRLTQLLKAKIVVLWEQKQSIKKIARDMGITRKTVRRWIERYEKTGDVECERQGPRPIAYTEESERHRNIVDAHSLAPFKTTRSTAETFGVSLSTVRRHLHAADIHNYKPAKKIKLTDDHRTKRVNFATRYLNFDWENEIVIFTDEKCFKSDKDGRKILWRRSGQRFAPENVLDLRTSGRLTLVLQCCLLVQAVIIRAAYYHEPSMSTIRPPEPLVTDSFFGYSIAFHDNSVVASAPRADQNGQLFSCDLASTNCTRMTVPITTATSRDSGGYHYDHNFWLGATVKAEKEHLFVCAPRCTSKFQDTSYFGTNGRCYFLPKGSPDRKFTPMSQISLHDRKLQYTRKENLTDSFGWSMDVDMNGALRVGSPAIAAGRASIYTEPTESTEPIIFSAVNKDSFNFGYSIASGDFISSNKPVHSNRRGRLPVRVVPGVAIGTPYGDNGVGKVHFFDNDRKRLVTVSDPTGGVGSMFGAALCSALIDGDSASLLVGAPAHFTGDSYHTGVVYVYRNVKTMMKVNTIEGPNKDGAFFGYAIANIGDMDRDGRDEIAIGAPYEDEGKGAVYLYTGSSMCDGKEPKWLQRFQPEARAFQNLGLSLVANRYSDGACSDLAIGAPGNDSVAVYHCLTVIAVDIQRTEPNLQNRTDKTSFTFDVCLNAKYPDQPKNIRARFSVRVKITHPNATLTEAKAYEDFIEYDEILDKITYPNGCRRINVTTTESSNNDQEIQFNITAKLLDDPASSTEFDPSKATVSSNSNLTSYLSVRAADCKQEPCEPKLTVNLTTNVKDRYLIGSSKTETVNVVVSNGKADTAYRPCVRVRVSGDATVFYAPPHCKFIDVRQRICQLQRALKPNGTWLASNPGIELGLESLTSESTQIQVVAEVFDRCEINNKPDDTHSIVIKLITNTDGLKIESKTDQGEMVVFRKAGFSNKTILHHTYTISNVGKINWVGLYCNIWLYREAYITYNHSIQIYSGTSERPPCHLKKNATDKSNFHGLSCELGNLNRKEKITVVIPITTVPAALEKALEKSNTTVKTVLRVVAGSHEEDKTELTTLVLQKATVPTWVIVVAVAVGILIVLLIAFALYECGLLRRKKKEELVQLKKEVKRKSMMLQRQSMRLTDSARAELRNRTYRELLDAAEIKEAEEAEEVRNSQLANTQDQADNGGASTVPNEPYGSHFDIRAHIEKTLRKP